MVALMAAYALLGRVHGHGNDHDDGDGDGDDDVHQLKISLLLFRAS